MSESSIHDTRAVNLKFLHVSRRVQRRNFKFRPPEFAHPDFSRLCGSQGE